MNEFQQQGQWRIKVAAGEFGPVDIETLKTWVREGRVTAQNSVFNPETNSWIPASAVPQLAGLLPPSVPQQPPRMMSPPSLPAAGEKKGMNVGCIVGIVAAAFFGLMLLGIMAGMLLPALARAREMARRVSCLNNIKQLGLASRQYLQDYRQVYPWHEGATDPGQAWRDLGLLFPNYCSSFETFFCPSSKDRLYKPIATNSGLKEQYPFDSFMGGNSTKTISYSYSHDSSKRKVLPWTEGAPPTVRLFADKKAGTELSPLSNHKDDGRNVLYNDGHAKWQTAFGWSSDGHAPFTLLDPDPEDDVADPAEWADWWSDPPYYRE